MTHPTTALVDTVVESAPGPPGKHTRGSSLIQVRALDATEDDLIVEGETVDDDEPVAEEADVDLTEDDIADEPPNKAGR